MNREHNEMDCPENIKNYSDNPSNLTNTVFFILSWLILGGLFVVAILQNTGAIDLLDSIPPCFFLETTGFYCPGCGGTHAVVSLVTGHPIDSFLAHPFVVYVAICALVFAIANTRARIRHKGYLPFRMLFVYIGIAALMIPWIIKNVCLLVE